jgi:hypothetical protein
MKMKTQHIRICKKRKKGKALLRRFTALNASMRKEKLSLIRSLITHLKKEEKNKPKASRKKQYR